MLVSYWNGFTLKHFLPCTARTVIMFTFDHKLKHKLCAKFLVFVHFECRVSCVSNLLEVMK